MNRIHRSSLLVALFTSWLLGTMAAQSGVIETDLVANVSPLVDSNGIVHVVPSAQVDPNLVNPWGVGESPRSPFWVSDNGAGKSTLYNTAGTRQSLVVSIPKPGDPLGSSGAPTGLVFNSSGGGFTITGVDSSNMPTSKPAIFLFSTEDGTILGWNPGVNPPGFDPAKKGTYAIIAVDNSSSGAVYKGLAIAADAMGNTLIYVTNFRAGTVETYNTSWKPALTADAFRDPTLPRGYAPFNIVPISGKMYVTYAVQDALKHDDVAGMSHGIVDTFDLAGENMVRFAQHGQLDSPWGITVAPASFGSIAGDILIGNFGNGHVNIFDPNTREFVDKLRDPHGQAIVIDGLWTLTVGNGGSGGDKNTVYFTAGPNMETDGLFGSLSPNQ